MTEHTERSAVFVTCPGCGQLMLGQRSGQTVYPQPHQCKEARDA